jgi:ribonucleoside-triphosphate reductase (thioredoxin)
MRDAKAGAWWDAAPARYIANNSAVYESRPPRRVFDEEWAALVASGSGERGMFSRAASAAQCAASRGRPSAGIALGTNPCSEIILRPHQFCNLTEARLPVAVRVSPVAAARLRTWRVVCVHTHLLRRQL